MKIRQQGKAKGDQRGVALVAAVITVFSAGALLSVVVTLAAASDKRAAVSVDASQARFLAEGALEVATRQTQVLIANWQTPTSLVVDTAEIAGQDVLYSIEPNGFVQIVTQTSGIKDFALGYELQAQAAVGDAVQRVRRIIRASATPIFQFAVFYTDELEVHPGPNMTLGGRVHSNSDMYLAPNGSTLTMNTNYVRAVGGIYRHRKNAVSASNGTVRIRKWVDNPFDATEPLSYVNMYNKAELLAAKWVDSTSGYDSHFTTLKDYNSDGDYSDEFDTLPFVLGALENWGPPVGYTKGFGHTVLTQDHGLGEAVTPSIGSIQMYEEVDPGTGSHALDPATGLYTPTVGGTHNPGFFNKNAGLKLLLEPDGSGGQVLKAYGPGGVDVTTALVSAGAIGTALVYDARQADDTADEHAKVKVIQVNVGLLNASGYFPANGLLYAAQYDAAEGTQTGGLMLVNGSELKGKLTCVAEGPVYVKGDYNTVGKKGAAVIGDAVNLLSNAWTGTKTKGSLPAATDTTFNLALITGNQTTTSSNYNGGLENLPRFHENWSGKRARINGSFVNAWNSQLATGNWLYGGDRYEAPIRDWNYDPDFNDFAKLPPFTPMAVWAEPIATW
jgi:hypothetical protein